MLQRLCPDSKRPHVIPRGPELLSSGRAALDSPTGPVGSCRLISELHRPVCTKALATSHTSIEPVFLGASSQASPLKAWCHANQQHRRHMGAGWKCRPSGPAPDLQNPNLHFNQSPGDSRAHYTSRSESVLSNGAKGAKALQGDARAHWAFPGQHPCQGPEIPGMLARFRASWPPHSPGSADQQVLRGTEAHRPL